MKKQDSWDSSKIEVLTAIEAIRRRTTMYVGPLDDPAVPVELLMQSLCHAVDCAIDGQCTSVKIAIKGRDVEVAYDAGIPLQEDKQPQDQVLNVFMSHLAGCHNRKKHIHVGHEFCNLGLAVLNALSERMAVTTRCAGLETTYTFERGEFRQALPIQAGQGPDATTMHFRLDSDIFGSNVYFDAGILEQSLLRVRHLLPELKVEKADT